MKRNYKKERTGEVSINSQGCKMKIIKYKNKRNVIVEFQDEHKAKIKTRYSEFKNKEIKNPYHPIVYGVGYFGMGKHIGWVNNKHTKKYRTWHGMMHRCYDNESISKRPTYKNTEVCDEWHNFQNFGDWYDDNFYYIDGKHSMSLDKDILIKGNNIYSPETCVFVTKEINNIFTKSDANRGEYPIGVTYEKSSGRYISRCKNTLVSIGGRGRVYLGRFDTPEMAFKAYKKYKESYIKKVADYYKEQIPKILYDALYAYKVEITD